MLLHPERVVPQVSTCFSHTTTYGNSHSILSAIYWLVITCLWRIQFRIIPAWKDDTLMQDVCLKQINYCSSLVSEVTFCWYIMLQVTLWGDDLTWVVATLLLPRLNIFCILSSLTMPIKSHKLTGENIRTVCGIINLIHIGVLKQTLHHVWWFRKEKIKYMYCVSGMVF